MGNRQTGFLSSGNFHDSYALGRKLGQGSFGQVRACNLRHGEHEKFVVKIMDARSTPDMPVQQLGRAPCINPELVEDIRNECEVWRKLEGSAYCVQLLHVFAHGCVYYLVMEQCQCSLLDKLEDMSTWTEAEMRHIFREMLHGIDFVHTRCIVHRDIKPDNFLYGLDKIVKLADFGLAASLPKPKTIGSVSAKDKNPGLQGQAGTAPYLSPEMLRGERYGYKTDVWSYGVSVYFMVYADFPYGPTAQTREEMKAAILSGTPEPSYTCRIQEERVQEGLAIQDVAKDFVKGLLDRSPKTRWSSRQALAADLFLDRLCLDQWSSENSNASSFELRPIVQQARQRSMEFSEKEKLDPTVATDLDELLSRLQQGHGGSSQELRRSFSLPLPAKAKVGPSLESLTEEDEVMSVSDAIFQVERRALTRASSTTSISGVGCRNGDASATLRRVNTHDGGGGFVFAEGERLASLLEMGSQESLVSQEMMSPKMSALGEDWSEDTWSDDLVEIADLPPAPPRLPPAKASALVAVLGH